MKLANMVKTFVRGVSFLYAQPYLPAKKLFSMNSHLLLRQIDPLARLRGWNIRVRKTNQIDLLVGQRKDFGRKPAFSQT